MLSRQNAMNTTDGALRIVLGVAEVAEMARLRRRVQQLEADAEDAKIVCPVLAAAQGDRFTHHTMDANHADWDEDEFEYVGRTDGSSRTPAGWLVFLHLGVGRGICAYGCNGGTNGGMRDAIGAWPLTKYYNYQPDGSYDEDEIALPMDMCWGFRRAQDYEHEPEDQEEGGEEGGEEEEDEVEASDMDSGEEESEEEESDGDA